MIRHVCMFKFKESSGGCTRAQNVAATKAMLDKLPQTIPQIISSQTFVGCECQSPDNFDLMLISDFESLETLEKYKIHPDHVAVGNFMRPVRISRTCIDFEIL